MNFIKSDKRGLSEIVTSILIILIAVAAVVVIWQVLLPLIRSPGEQSVSLADCTANPVTLSTPVCNRGANPEGTVSVQATKLGPKPISNVVINFNNEAGTEPSTGGSATGLAGTAIYSSSVATYGANEKVVVSGTYTLTGTTSPCSIPEVKTVTC